MCANSSVTLHLTIIQRLHPGFAVKTALNCCEISSKRREKGEQQLKKKKLQALQPPSGNVLNLEDVKKAAKLLEEDGWEVKLGKSVLTSFNDSEVSVTRRVPKISIGYAASVILF